MGTILTILGCALILVSMVVLGIFVLFILDRFRYRKQSPEEIEVANRLFREKLKNPDLKVFEEHFGHSLPVLIKQLYENKDEIVRHDFEVAPRDDSTEDDRWYIAFYEPAVAESLKYIWSGCEKYFAFANDGFGNQYMIDPVFEDPPVMFHDHESGEFVPVCDKLSQFLAWPKLVPLPSE